MSRIRAAALALVVTFAIFGGAMAAAYWLLGTTSLLETLNARWFPAAVVVFNGLVISVLLAIVALRSRRSEKELDSERSTLRAAAERLRRSRG